MRFTNDFTYYDYLQTPHWKVKAARIKKERCLCEQCGATLGLQIHHKTYARCPFFELDSDLVCWCDRCHQEHHDCENSLRMVDKLEQWRREFSKKMKNN